MGAKTLNGLRFARLVEAPCTVPHALALNAAHAESSGWLDGHPFAVQLEQS